MSVPNIPLGPSPTPPAIYSLPNELLAAITAAGQEGRAPDCSQTKVFKSEWALSHVCRRFRDVVIGTPTLWTLVEVGPGVGVTEILQLYLERSRSCELWAVVQDQDTLDDPDLVAEYLSPIISQTDRIWGLRIVAEADSMRAVLAEFRDVAASALTHLEIQAVDSALSNDSLPLFTGGPPRALAFLRLVNFTPQLPIPQWTTSLTHLDLGIISDGEEGPGGNSVSAALIPRCPALVHLFIDMAWGSESHMARVTIPSLKSLHITIDDSEGPPFLLTIIGLFNTPALTDLTIVHTHGDQICLLFDSTSLPDSSFPALTSLSFIQSGGCDCEGDPNMCQALQPIPSPPLRLFPVLSSLTLINQCFTPHIIEQILGPDAPPWPLLETLTLCPHEADVGAACNALRNAVRFTRRQAQAFPTFRFSPILFDRLAREPYSDWDDENRANVELYDPTEVLAVTMELRT